MEEKKYLTKEELNKEWLELNSDLEHLIFAHAKSDKETEEAFDTINAKIDKMLQENCYILDMWLSIIKPNVPYKLELVRPKDCPYGKDGRCQSCKNIYMYKTEDSSSVGVAKACIGYCLKNPVE